MVDDGSPDSCGEICDNYAEKDDRVRVIHKENGGQGSARNRGLDIAKGEYIAAGNALKNKSFKALLNGSDKKH